LKEASMGTRLLSVEELESLFLDPPMGNELVCFARYLIAESMLIEDAREGVKGDLYQILKGTMEAEGLLFPWR
jgi:hypothetical protein